MGKIYQVIVHGIRGENKTIDLCNTEEQMKSMTVKQLRVKIAEKIPEIDGVMGVMLIFADKWLDNDTELLSTYGIQNMSHIHAVMKLPGGHQLR